MGTACPQDPNVATSRRQPVRVVCAVIAHSKSVPVAASVSWLHLSGADSHPALCCFRGAGGYGLAAGCEIIPIVPSHVSINFGQPVTGSFVRRNPNPWPPCAYKCISTGTPAFFNPM